MINTTKLQKEVLSVIATELTDIKDTKNVNAYETFTDIDKLCEGMMKGTIEPQLTPKQCDRLNDILLELVTFIRDLER